MSVVRMCPKCKNLSAQYEYNNAGNLVFTKCVKCGYSAKNYAKDLKGH